MPTVDIDDSVEEIRKFWPEIRIDFFQAVPEKYLKITTVHRTPAEQFELYKKGRSLNPMGQWQVVDSKSVVTNADGIKVLSAHNYYPSRAIDLAVVNNQTGEYYWNPEWYASLLEIAKTYGLVSGGAWNKLKDWPHLEIPNYKTYKGA
jgi:hypothetical protein